jgi:hypothetical protein
MSRGPQPFRQGDLTKVLKAMVKAGIAVRRVEYKDGKTVVVTGTPEDADGKNPEENEWNDVLH